MASSLFFVPLVLATGPPSSSPSVTSRRHPTLCASPASPPPASPPPTSSSPTSTAPNSPPPTPTPPAAPPGAPPSPAALEAQLRAELASEGIDFDELLDSARVLSLAQQLARLRAALSAPSARPPLAPAARAGLAATLARTERAYARARRAVMGGALKRIFVGQAWALGALGGVLAAAGGLPDVVRALGFWMPWLFAVPSLRARKGLPAPEKAALNAAFLAMPLLNLAVPYATKDFVLIWGLNVALLAGCYAYYYGVAGRSAPGEKVGAGLRIRGLLRYLDWGSWR